MQQIINYYFQKPWSGVDKPKKPLSEITGVPEFFKNWRYRTHPWKQTSYLGRLLDKLNTYGLNWSNIDHWVAMYDLAIPPYTKNCRYLLPGCLNVLTPKHRKRLAQSRDYFFVKTHGYPYTEYFSGEYVIQMIRHPGPVFISYAKLIKQIELERIIKGQVFVGSWSNWHHNWKQVIPALSDCFIRLKYENVISDMTKACESIKGTINLGYRNIDVDIPTFDKLKQQSPEYYGVGYSEGWEQKYTSAQRSLLYQLHGHTMHDFGYT